MNFTDARTVEIWTRAALKDDDVLVAAPYTCVRIMERGARAEWTLVSLRRVAAVIKARRPYETILKFGKADDAEKLLAELDELLEQ